VALLTDEIVRTLAGFRGDTAPVTTCYLDVDGRRKPSHADIERELAGLVRRAGLNGHSADASVVEDVRRIRQYVKGLARGATRGVALFSCSSRGFWQVFELPVPVTSQLVVEPMPSVRQLEGLLEEYERIGVLLVDRQRARMYVFDLGELVDHSEHFDRLERQGEDVRGELVKTRVGSQLSEQARQHVKRAAQLAFDVYQRVGFDHLVIGAPAEVRTELDHLLHPYLRDRVADQLSVPAGAPADQVRAAALEVEERIERRSEARLVDMLRDAVGARLRAVAGLGPTLKALAERRIDRLFVSAGYQAEGWRCPSCGALAVVGRGCGACGSSMEKVPDVVEVAVADGLGQGCRVNVCSGNADLDVLGRIGALLRY
jgi:peptide subunit release factor 1 (eRF1)